MSDVDECLENGGRGPCDQVCIDLLGSYRCSCRDGYELSADGFACVYADKCRSSPCLNGATCLGGIGDYTCQCPSGFKGDNCEFATCSEDFAPPEHGSATCADVSTGGRFCTVACDAQHDFSCRPADAYTCDLKGEWHLLGRANCHTDDLAEDAPWPDCSRIRLAWLSVMSNDVDFYYNGDCQSNAAEITQMFERLFNTLGGAATSGTADGDGKGDACDEDIDGDGYLNDQDNCPLIANPDQTDSDIDGVGSMCDNCVSTPNPDQANSDDTEAGDPCEAALEQVIAKLCEDQPDGTYLPHPYDCSMYVACHRVGHDGVFNCPPGTRWSQELLSCARSDLATCD
ncbi:THBS1 [Branchiostoma lanceolatum]|uniref:chitinase n=1 Tax=Branchiostoma lanceolatum TaxID=7740 RepID=A0A8J9VYS8_BRALA|nr:THBS1 [Branchiostoma lanceolatum]